MSSNYNYNTRSKANQAQRGAKPDTGIPWMNNLIAPGKVLEVNGGGWDVAVVDESGEMSRVYERVFAWPSSSTLQPNQEVWLYLPDDGENPLIIVAGGGGGGSTCAMGVNTFGVLRN